MACSITLNICACECLSCIVVVAAFFLFLSSFTLVCIRFYTHFFFLLRPLVCECLSRQSIELFVVCISYVYAFISLLCLDVLLPLLFSVSVSVHRCNAHNTLKKKKNNNLSICHTEPISFSFILLPSFNMSITLHTNSNTYNLIRIFLFIKLLHYTNIYLTTHYIICSSPPYNHLVSLCTTILQYINNSNKIAAKE